MGAFSRVLERSTAKPARVITLQPNAFADTWSERPSGPVQIGLRLIPESELHTARAEAAKVAWQLHPESADEDNRIDAFNDALMCWQVAVATCSPTDSRLPFWDCANDAVPMALTSKAIRHVWEQTELLSIEQSPSSREATDDDLAALTRAINDGSLWQDRSVTDARSLRRLLGRVIELAALTGG
jgi:hypothetical protein